MLILLPDFKQCRQTFPDAILIFGTGLLGSAIYRNIVAQLDKLAQHKCDFDWHDAKMQLRQIDGIIANLGSLRFNKNRESARIAIVWSAGKSGFYSADAELQQEQVNFETILSLAHRVRELLPNSNIEFHFISSAGGIFEGCGYVDVSTTPRPLRPYGHNKLAQEQLLLEQNHLIPRIYRPSTVYGPIQHGLRCGFVSTLIRNGVLRAVTNISGHLHTLRDYVYSEDIGKFVTHIIQQDRQENARTIFHLSSGKTSSIFEVIKIVEFLLKHRIYYKLEYDPINNRDIVFSQDIRSDNWSPVDLRIGCERVLHSWSQTYPKYRNFQA